MSSVFRATWFSSWFRCAAPPVVAVRGIALADEVVDHVELVAPRRHEDAVRLEPPFGRVAPRLDAVPLVQARLLGRLDVAAVRRVEFVDPVAVALDDVLVRSHARLLPDRTAPAVLRQARRHPRAPSMEACSDPQ